MWRNVVIAETTTAQPHHSGLLRRPSLTTRACFVTTLFVTTSSGVATFHLLHESLEVQCWHNINVVIFLTRALTRTIARQLIVLVVVSVASVAGNTGGGQRDENLLGFHPLSTRFVAHQKQKNVLY